MAGYSDNREDLLRRLHKIEGQVRGLQRMIDEDRYCVDIIQQISTLTSSEREVELRVLEDHLRGGGAEAFKEMVHVLRRTLRP